MFWGAKPVSEPKFTSDELANMVIRFAAEISLDGPTLIADYCRAFSFTLGQTAERLGTSYKQVILGEGVSSDALLQSTNYLFEESKEMIEISHRVSWPEIRRLAHCQSRAQAVLAILHRIIWHQRDMDADHDELNARLVTLQEFAFLLNAPSNETNEMKNSSTDSCS